MSDDNTVTINNSPKSVFMRLLECHDLAKCHHVGEAVRSPGRRVLELSESYVLHTLPCNPRISPILLKNKKNSHFLHELL